VTEPAFLDAAVRVALHLAGRAAWQAGTCAWPAAGARPGPDVYAGSAGIAWFLAEVDRVAPHPALRRAAEGGIRHALRAAQALEGDAAAGFYHGRVGVACAAARAAALSGREDLRAAAEALLRPLAEEGGLPDGPVGVRHGAAGAVPALLEPPGPLDAALCRALAARLGERILRRAAREPWGWSWTDPDAVYVRPPTGLGHGASGVGRASLELFRVLGDGRHRYAAEQALLYERRFFEPSARAWFDLRHPGLSALLQHDGPEGLADHVRREGGGTPWLGHAAFAWCHGAAGIGLVRLRAWQLLGRESYRAEAEAAVRATLGYLPGQSDPGLCHGIAGSGELLLAAGRLLDRPEWRAAADEAGARLLAGGRLRALPAAGAVPGAPLPPGVMLGEAGAGWFFLRLHDASTPSILLPGAESSPVLLPDADDGSGGYAGERRDHVDAFFAGSLGALAGHGAAAAVDAARDVEAAAGPERSAPLAVYRALRRKIIADPRAAWSRAVAVDLARFELLLGITDLAEEKVEEWRRQEADALEWSGDTLLHVSRRARAVGDRLLLRTGTAVEEHAVGAMEARVLARASRFPARAGAIADAEALPGVLAAARALYARGALDVLPGPTLADAAAAYIAAAVTDPVPPASLFRDGAGQVRMAVGGAWEQSTEPRFSTASDPLLVAWQGDSAAAALQRALPAAAMEPLFRDDLEAYWRAPSAGERRRILAELAAVLSAVFGSRPFVRGVYFSAPIPPAAGQSAPAA
jgi:hypothetical protein